MNVTALQTFRQKLLSGHFCMGTAISFTDPTISAALADSLDFLWIDTEHAMMSMEAVRGHVLAGQAHNTPVLVRVPGSGMQWIKPALDSGADGIIVPQIYSAEEAREVVRDCRYPPLGRRGFGPRVPSNFGRISPIEVIERANKAVFVSVQIETAEALAEIDEILAIDGLDSVVIGPFDLSASLGFPGQPEHPQVLAGIASIVQKAKVAGKFVGAGGGADMGYVTRMKERGIQWQQSGNDFEYLVRYVDSLIKQVRG